MKKNQLQTSLKEMENTSYSVMHIEDKEINTSPKMEKYVFPSMDIMDAIRDKLENRITPLMDEKQLELIHDILVDINLVIAKSQEITRITRGKTLYLTLNKEAFEVMVTGEKKLEIRKPSKWIKSRLMHKDGTLKEYDQIQFKNGYGDRPQFTCEYIGFNISRKEAHVKTFGNGFEVIVEPGDIEIICGQILSKNLNP